ncbi:hypothetical protein SGL43_06559 [Streptomyces globisporus]|uniref:Uncharacterized protein n=1 Tax=Streptomyces globisporus TaxID=1908 RepID=A0ABM9H771_STRGL|nr:hypothetical protein [Streptomyces globisporus]CAH9419504.1 hypothetical protein SGL43_06559 [Streptomyces globisporus]
MAATTPDLPLWAWNLIIAIQSYEDQHSSTHTCLQQVLTAVPEDVRHQAEGISSYVRKASGDELAAKVTKRWDDIFGSFFATGDTEPAEGETEPTP